MPVSEEFRRWLSPAGYMGKGGSNMYVIGILLILSINILQPLSRAQPCPAAAMGSKAKFRSRRSANTYLLTQFPTHSEMPEQFTRILVDRECVSL